MGIRRLGLGLERSWDGCLDAVVGNGGGIRVGTRIGFVFVVVVRENCRLYQFTPHHTPFSHHVFIVYLILHSNVFHRPITPPIRNRRILRTTMFHPTRHIGVPQYGHRQDQHRCSVAHSPSFDASTVPSKKAVPFPHRMPRTDQK